jgi:hypothetical protein
VTNLPQNVHFITITPFTPFSLKKYVFLNNSYNCEAK